MARNKESFFWNSSVYSCSEKLRLFHARNCQETEDLVQRYVVLHSQKSAKLAITRIERGVGGPGAQLSKRTSTLECLVRYLTGPQLAASLNSTRKTPISTSTVKRWLLDAGLLGRVPLSSVCSFVHLYLLFLLASLRYIFLQLCYGTFYRQVSNQLNLPQVDSNQVEETSQGWSMETMETGCTWAQFWVS